MMESRRTTRMLFLWKLTRTTIKTTVYLPTEMVPAPVLCFLLRRPLQRITTTKTKTEMHRRARKTQVRRPRWTTTW